MQSAYRRIGASLTLFVFLLTQNASLGMALPSANARAQIPSSLTREHLSNLFIPSEFGSVQEIHLGNSDRQVILIQDAHANYDAQLSIENLINFFANEYNIQLVALEGGTGEMDATLFKTYPDLKTSRDVFESYLSKGEISGAVAAAVFGEDTLTFKGMEDKELYAKEIELFINAYEKNTSLLKTLGQTRERLEDEKKKIYSNELIAFDQRVQTASHDEEHFSELVKDLLQKHDVNQYPTLEIIKNEMTSDLDLSKLTALFARMKYPTSKT